MKPGDELVPLEEGAAIAGVPYREMLDLVEGGIVAIVPIGGRRVAVRLSELEMLALGPPDDYPEDDNVVTFPRRSQESG